MTIKLTEKSCDDLSTRLHSVACACSDLLVMESDEKMEASSESAVWLSGKVLSHAKSRGVGLADLPIESIARFLTPQDMGRLCQVSRAFAPYSDHSAPVWKAVWHWEDSVLQQFRKGSNEAAFEAMRAEMLLRQGKLSAECASDVDEEYGSADPVSSMLLVDSRPMFGLMSGSLTIGNHSCAAASDEAAASSEADLSSKDSAVRVRLGTSSVRHMQPVPSGGVLAALFNGEVWHVGPKEVLQGRLPFAVGGASRAMSADGLLGGDLSRLLRASSKETVGGGLAGEWGHLEQRLVCSDDSGPAFALCVLPPPPRRAMSTDSLRDGSAAASRVAIARGSGQIDIRSFSTGMVLLTIKGHEQAITDLVACRGSFGAPSIRWGAVRLVSGSRDGTLRVWDADDGTDLCTLRHGAPVWTVQSYNGQVFSGGADGRVVCWDADTGEMRRSFSIPKQVCCLRVFGVTLLMGSSNGRLHCVDTVSGKKLWEAKVFGERCPVRRVLVDATRRTLYVTSQFGVLREVRY
jgi:hypothetical protein